VHQTPEQAREALLHLVHRCPTCFGISRARWTLSALGEVCSFLAGKTPSGIWHLLDRLDIHYKRGRGHVHSPDPDYLEKLREVHSLIRQALNHPNQYVVLFEDEFTFYRQPSLAQAWEEAGQKQARAELGHTCNTHARVVAALNVLTGTVHSLQRSRIGVKALVDFYEKLHQAYPQAQQIWVVQDNWPVHFHPDVLAALHCPDIAWPVKVTPYWSEEPSAKARRLNLPIRLAPLPTYASWCNPIEKLWRLLRQERLHLHAFGDQWTQLKQAVNQFLSELGNRAQELLGYVGLKDPLALYAAALQPTANTG
jgi:hypothetical protein